MRKILCLSTVLLVCFAAMGATWVLPGKGQHFDSDAQDFFDRVVSNGGTISAATKTAVNNFVVAAKAHSYWTKINRINLICGDQLAAALVPLKVGTGNSIDTNTNFVGGDYSESTGLAGNGSNKRLATGVSVNELTMGDSHLSFAGTNMETSASSAAFVLIGGQGGGAANYPGFSLRSYLDVGAPRQGRSYLQDNDFFAGGATETCWTTVPSTDHVTGTATSTTSCKIYSFATDKATDTDTVSTSANTTDIFVFAENSGDGVSSYTTATCRGYSMGSGLSSTDVSNYVTDLEAFNDALGRGLQ